MPCDQVQVVNVKWDQKSTDLTLLAQALTALGKSAHVYKDTVVFFGGKFANGNFQYDSTYYNRVSPAQASQEVAQVKRAYSAEVVKAQAKKWGWQLKETAPYQYEIVKR